MTVPNMIYDLVLCMYRSNKQTQQHSQEEEDEEIVEIHIQNDLVEETEKKKKQHFSNSFHFDQ